MNQLITTDAEKINRFVSVLLPYVVLLLGPIVVVVKNFDTISLYILQGWRTADPRMFFLGIEILVILLLAVVSCSAYSKESTIYSGHAIQKLGYTPGLYLFLYMGCFGMAIASISKPLLVLGWLVCIYYIYCYANSSFITAWIRIRSISPSREASKAVERVISDANKHYDFVMHENSVSLIGYAVLVIVLGLFVVFLNLGSDFVAAFCAGAATLHLCVSVASYASTMHESAPRSDASEMVRRVAGKMFAGRLLLVTSAVVVPMAVYIPRGASWGSDLVPTLFLAVFASLLAVFLGRARF